MKKLLLFSALFAFFSSGCKFECEAGNLNQSDDDEKKAATPLKKGEEAPPPAAKPAPQEGLKLCTQVKDKTCQDPTDAFKREVTEIHVVYVSKKVPESAKKATVVWIAADTGGAAPPNFKIAIKEFNLANAGLKDATHVTITGSLTRPNKGWPLGKYRVEVNLEGKLVAQGAFTISE